MARILLIEDSPTDRAVFTQWLERGGHQVIPASNAEDGLEIARKQLPDLVLMDVVLPGMSGFQATRALTRDAATSRIPVLIVSSKHRDPDDLHGIPPRPADYLDKSTREDDLLERINKLVAA